MAIEKKKIPSYWGSVLQGLSHWVAYKQQYFRDHLLPEGAIVAELTQLLSAKIDTNLAIECESTYSKFYNITKDQRRADIVVVPKNDEENYHSYTGHIPIEIIEVKRYEGSFDRINKDAEKLFELKKHVPNVRLYQVIVGQKEPPLELITDNANAKRQNVYSGKINIEAHPRLLKKAFGSKSDSKKGTYSALVEIL